ncbi:hypothetical protein BS78_05G012200 [Paspalum vaginatum]|nr:hypothetical protein BS78_05G012200 [Paspalum vaginatum]
MEDLAPFLLFVLICLCMVVGLVLACLDGYLDDDGPAAGGRRHQPREMDAKAATAIVLLQLGQVTYRRENINAAAASDPPAGGGAGSEEDDCAICLGAFEDGDLCSVMPTCRHEFHKACIAGWLKAGNNTCPLCRAELRQALVQAMV